MHLSRVELQLITKISSKSDELYNVVAGCCEFFKNQHGEIFLICYTVDGYETAYLAHSNTVKSFIRKKFFALYNTTVKSSDVSNAYETLCAVADDTPDVKAVYPRVAFDAGCIYYDLNNQTHDVVKIDSKAVVIVKKTDVKNLIFSKDSSMTEQVIPVNKGYGVVDFVRDFIMVAKEQRILIVVYICAAFIQHISHPILIVEGEKGAGKSAFFQFLMEIINPVSKDVFVMPEGVDNLITVLSNNNFSAFDNLGSSLSDEVSNVLCQASTGGTLIKRKYYSDNTEFCINIKRLVALNGIDLEISQSDLLDRAILVRLQRIDETNRRTSEDLKKFFRSNLPSILADIFEILSKALEIYPKLSLSSYPRMADFSKFGYAIAEAIGTGNGEKFLEQYRDNMKLAVESAVEENPLLECVKHIVNSEGYFKGSMTDFLMKLKNVLPKFYIGHQLPASFPKTANALSRRLNTSRHELESLGITIEIGRSKERYVVIKKNSENIDVTDAIDAIDDVDDVDDSFKK